MTYQEKLIKFVELKDKFVLSKIGIKYAKEKVIYDLLLLYSLLESIKGNNE